MGAKPNRLEYERAASEIDPNDSDGSPANKVEDRFAKLAGDAWQKLPAPVRRRFSARLSDGERVVYVGEVAYTRLNLFGALIAQLARLVGAPLPLESGSRMPVTVIVSGCTRLRGQIWTRIYDRARELPQVIQSIKRFGGTTGLEEIVGHGVGMRLTLAVIDRALVFRSAGYFITFLGIQFSLPDWLTPGMIEVVHREESSGSFSFSLTVTHALAGRAIEQIAFFRGEVP
jgi:Domain of unknown function (DUF4166)